MTHSCFNKGEKNIFSNYFFSLPSIWESFPIKEATKNHKYTFSQNDNICKQTLLKIIKRVFQLII